LADLVTSFENAKQKCTFGLPRQKGAKLTALTAIRRDNNLGAVNEILEAGYPNIPQAADAEK
jgi:CCR4-NOT transcription complex subunit 3